ncbi:YbaN family protein [Pelagibius sp. Alg239-R121]|uniref:YbaN family protein n=1 Tax=Pelagibius sp. Alg239-R121 TaxID=2993448 RepID=UPI0024A61722|nr:YbaN family protein [Pelagibius sp. Alg239-R121]
MLFRRDEWNLLKGGAVLHSTTRFFWRVAGLISLVLGIIGIFLPLLPTTPFVLLSAFCFSRGSQRLHDWLLTHPRLGPPILEWRDHGAISKRAKWLAAIAMILAFVVALLGGAPKEALVIQVVVLLGVAVFIFTRPIPPADES